MDLKDVLPLLGILVGWGLAEGSAFGKRSIERRRVIGRALSLLYFLFHEMVQVKQAQEYAKNQSQDVHEWERTRQRAFAQYTVSSDEHSQKLAKTADELGEYFPIEAYRLRQLLWQYEFVKTRKLDLFAKRPKAYLAVLSSYEMSYLIYQYQLELLLRFLAFRQRKWLWLRLRYQLWRMQRATPKGDIVFIQQMKGFRTKFKKFGKPKAGPNSLSEIVMRAMSSEDDAGPVPTNASAAPAESSNPSFKRTSDGAA